MEITQKECFCPEFVNRFGLQPVAKYARKTWEFVNLYSQTRGANRLLALVRALDLLAERPEVRARGVEVPALPGLRDWIGRETKLGNPALEAELERTANADLERVYAWSLAANAAVERIVRDVPPFPLVRECLVRLGEQADTIVVSQTPTVALRREWAEHGLDGLVRAIAGQEMGTKAEHLALAAGDRYAAGHVLMIGDAPGDLAAAEHANALFFPVNPGRVEDSWRLLYEEAADRFLAGTFAGDYQKRLVDEFMRRLPDEPRGRRRW